MPDLTYRVTAALGGTRYGSESTLHTPRVLADALAHETRIVRIDMEGSLTVYVWPSRVDEHHQLPIPDDAHSFDYPA